MKRKKRISINKSKTSGNKGNEKTRFNGLDPDTIKNGATFNLLQTKEMIMALRSNVNKTMAFLSIAILLSVLSSCATTQSGSQKSTLLNPGLYKDWHNMINELEIVQPFELKTYSKIEIVKLDTSATPLPFQSDNTYAPTRKVLDAADAIFLEGFKMAFDRTQSKPACAILQTPVMPLNDPAAPALIITGSVVQLNPGSKAARFWVGLGAGKSYAIIEGQVIDSISGNPLLKFKTARSSGFSLTGGDYEKFMSGDVRDVGFDVATMLLQFQNVKTE